MPDWLHSQYRQTGTARQQSTYTALERLGILAALRAYTPVLAGTIPLDIDTEDSDLDVLCHVPAARAAAFEAELRTHYHQLPGFQLEQLVADGWPTVLCQFAAHGFAGEIFGQDRAPSGQTAYRHMVVEYQLLRAGGPALAAAVRALKQCGLKTEPAFAQLLGLAGNPYHALLALEALPLPELQLLVAGRAGT